MNCNIYWMTLRLIGSCQCSRLGSGLGSVLSAMANGLTAVWPRSVRSDQWSQNLTVQCGDQ